MFRVYYTVAETGIESVDFSADKLSNALAFMNNLRNDPDVSFVVMASENPNSVGKPGAAAAGADYNWTKRRNNERDLNVAVSRRKTYNANDEVEVPMDEE
jgi:hypothetical protein